MIVNLTQHKATLDQILAGVVDLPPEGQELLKTLLTFEGDEPPTPDMVSQRAFQIVSCMLDFAPYQHQKSHMAAMIGGAPFLMPALHQELVDTGIEPLYAYSKRVSEEKMAEDGTLVKSSVFKHIGFVRPT